MINILALGVYAPMAPAKGSAGSLASNFQTFWSTLTGQWTSLTTLLTIIGMILVIAAVVKFVFAKARGKGGDAKELVISILVGAFLLKPDIIIKIVLGFADGIINATTSMLGKFF